MPRCRSFLPDLMTVRAVMVRAAMEKKILRARIALQVLLVQEGLLESQQFRVFRMLMAVNSGFMPGMGGFGPQQTVGGGCESPSNERRELSWKCWKPNARELSF